MDDEGARVDLTMAYAGTRASSERAGLVRAADTQSVWGGFPRVLMRLAAQPAEGVRPASAGRRPAR